MPIAKKEDGDTAGDYGRMMLMSTLYKIYAMMLAKKLSGKIEERGMMPEGQTRFRKGRGTVDNIYMQNYIEREINRILIFVDFKAAFDIERRKV